MARTQSFARFARSEPWMRICASHIPYSLLRIGDNTYDTYIRIMNCHMLYWSISLCICVEMCVHDASECIMMAMERCIFAKPSIECPSSRQNALRKGLRRVGSHLQTRRGWRDNVSQQPRFNAPGKLAGNGRDISDIDNYVFGKSSIHFAHVDSTEMCEQFSRHVKCSDISLAISILKMRSITHDFGYLGATFKYNKPISRYWFLHRGREGKRYWESLHQKLEAGSSNHVGAIAKQPETPWRLIDVIVS